MTKEEKLMSNKNLLKAKNNTLKCPLIAIQIMKLILFFLQLTLNVPPGVKHNSFFGDFPSNLICILQLIALNFDDKNHII